MTHLFSSLHIPFNITYNDPAEPWGLFFQDNATPQMEGLEELHNNIMFYLAVILFAVSWIMLSIILNYRLAKISNKYISQNKTDKNQIPNPHTFVTTTIQSSIGGIFFNVVDTIMVLLLGSIFMLLLNGAHGYLSTRGIIDMDTLINDTSESIQNMADLTLRVLNYDFASRADFLEHYSLLGYQLNHIENIMDAFFRRVSWFERNTEIDTTRFDLIGTDFMRRHSIIVDTIRLMEDKWNIPLADRVNAQVFDL